MKHKFLVTVIFFAASAAMFWSCQKNECPGEEDAGVVDVSVRVGVAAMETEIRTRSSFITYDDSLRNLNLFIYDEHGDLYRQSYSIVYSPLLTVRLEKYRKYTVLALANMGKEIPAAKRLDDMLEFKIDSVSMFDMDARYEPMSFRSELNVTDGSVLYVELERLPARLNVKFDKSGLSNEFTVTDVRLKQSRSICYPFSIRGSSWRRALSKSDVHDGDFASTDDLTELNSGGYISLYLFENEQGTLLPVNTDPWMKIPKSLSDLSERCTYIEILGNYNEVTGVGCRAYLGKDATKNFDVFRNSSDTLVIKLTDSGLGKEDNWKIIQGH